MVANRERRRPSVRSERSYVSLGRVYPTVGKHFSYDRDPKDEPYLNLAIEAQAKFLASRDNDILDLRSSAEPLAVEFRQKFPEIRIVDPLEFLRSVRAEIELG
jgi:predicted nucleic acid-binding protein